MDDGRGHLVAGRDFADMIRNAQAQGVSPQRIEDAERVDAGVFRVGETVHLKNSVFVVTRIDRQHLTLKIQPSERLEMSDEEKADLRADLARWKTRALEAEARSAVCGRTL